MNKRTLATFTLSCLLVSTIAISAGTLYSQNIPNVHATTGDAAYIMVFDENSQSLYNGGDNQNPSGEGVGTITNERGNEFQFGYNKFIGCGYCWQKMKEWEGYLRNVTPICGITSIEITTYDEVAEFEVYYGVSYDDVNNQHINSESSALNHVFDLSEFKPNFFKIQVHNPDQHKVKPIEFKEIRITYGCIQYSAVNATSSNETFGSVSGSGLYPVGQEVTLTATPVSDFQNKNYGIFQGWYDGETKLTDDLSYTFTPTAGTYFYNYEAKFVEADSEEFTIAHRLYYGDNSPANTVSALLLRNGRYYILASYCAYDWGDQNANVGPDEQTFKENEVFVSYGRGLDKDTNDIYLNRSDNLGVYYKTPDDHTFENRALVSAFYTEIKSIDFYIDISDSNNINGFDLSIEEHGSLAKCDIIDAKSARVTLYNGDFDYVNNSIAILVPNRLETNRKLVITKVVVHYNHS